MQVYAEYAFIENFCMDFTLLAAAKLASKNPARYRRLATASVLGACFAIAFPLFGLNGALGIAIKLAAGFIMCAVAGRYQSFKGYAKFTALFTAATFVTGGALIAVFSLAGVSYQGGGGYLISSVPVGIPLFAALCLAIITKRVVGKFKQNKSITASCTIYCGENKAVCSGFYDSGNNVYCGGAPVSIIPPHVAKKLTEEESIKNGVDIHNVQGK